MRILITSYVFSPSLGGIETVSALLATEFARAGHEVKLVTKTRKDDGRSWPFEVVRAPNVQAMLKLTRWCDIFFQNNISLELAWPLLLLKRPWVVAHHAPLNYAEKTKFRFKSFLLRFATNIAISRSIADMLPGSSTIVGDPYGADVFKLRPGNQPRPRTCLFGTDGFG